MGGIFSPPRVGRSVFFVSPTKPSASHLRRLCRPRFGQFGWAGTACVVSSSGIAPSRGCCCGRHFSFSRWRGLYLPPRFRSVFSLLWHWTWDAFQIKLHEQTQLLKPWGRFSAAPSLGLALGDMSESYFTGLPREPTVSHSLTIVLAIVLLGFESPLSSSNFDLVFFSLPLNFFTLSRSCDIQTTLML